MTSHKQTIAFFGATGGTGAACLSNALKEGHHCTAREYPAYANTQSTSV